MAFNRVLAFLFFLPLLARADFDGVAWLETPFVVDEAPVSPYGFEPRHLRPAYRLGISTRRFPEENDPVRVYFDAELGFLPYSLIPNLAAGAGLYGRAGPVAWSAGLEGGTQTFVQKTPFHGSQYSTHFYSFAAAVDYLFSIGRAGAKLKFIQPLDTTIATSEGFDTEIGHALTWVFSPEAELVLIAGIRVHAGFDLYSLGTTAVGSKEFAFAMPRGKPVLRYRAGLTVPLTGRLALTGEVQRVSHDSDEIELFYRAPFFGADYLLSPTVVTGGLTWKL